MILGEGILQVKREKNTITATIYVQDCRRNLSPCLTKHNDKDGQAFTGLIEDKNLSNTELSSFSACCNDIIKDHLCGLLAVTFRKLAPMSILADVAPPPLNGISRETSSQ